jgi:copper chaperone
MQAHQAGQARLENGARRAKLGCSNGLISREFDMIAFQVKDMTCGHCVSTITRAVKAVDSAARVEIDLAAQRVTIAPVTADASALLDAISAAGYTPVPIAAAGR